MKKLSISAAIITFMLVGIFVPANTTEASSFDIRCIVDDTTVEEDESVRFEVDIDGGDSPFDIEWDFDDGDDSDEEVVNHSFDDEGTYRVTVTVEDDDGHTETDTCSSIEVDNDNNDDLEISCSVDDRSIDEGDRVRFEVDIDGGDYPFEIEWDFDDGEDSDSQIISHRYDDEGTYRATVTVEDDAGNRETDECPSIDVDKDNDNNNNDDDLDIECIVDDTSIRAGETVRYRVIIDGGDSPFDIEWDGDISGDDRTETVRYNRNGTYEVEVEVEDDVGNRETDSCPDVRVSNSGSSNNSNINVFTGGGTNASGGGNYGVPRPLPNGQFAALNSVFLSQVPYTGPEDVAKVAGIIALALVWSVAVGMWLKKRRAVVSVSNKINDFKNRNKEAVRIS